MNLTEAELDMLDEALLTGKIRMPAVTTCWLGRRTSIQMQRARLEPSVLWQ